MPAALLELKSRPERTMLTVRWPDTVPFSAIPVSLPVMVALLRVDISMLRPSSAVRVTPPVSASANAPTPVLAAWALMAAAICVPRTTAEDAAETAPISKPLTQMSPPAIALKLPAGAVALTTVTRAVAVTPVRPVLRLIAAALSFALLPAAAPMATPFKVRPPAAKASGPTVTPLLCWTAPKASS